MMKKLLFLFVAMVTSVSLWAQVTSSNISGRVTDRNNEPLPFATIVATHTTSGTQYYAASDADGYYRIGNVRAGGPYKMEVRMVSYKPIVEEGILTGLGETKVKNFKMVEESYNLDEVVVTAEAIPNGMDSDRTGTTTAVSSEDIVKLPTVSRSLNDVLALTPQASSTSNGLAIGGGNYRQSYVTVDGAAFNNAFGIGSNLPAGGSPISLDALEAMTINITPFDVRQSGFTGGAINAVTKSGTNDFHFTIYDYFNNDGLVGTKYGTRKDPKQLSLSNSLDNTFGVSVGGPIVKNKLFYFVNFEYQADEKVAQDRLARENESQEWGVGTQYNMPTVAQMDEISNYLQSTYSYNPGRYQNYSAKTPDFKVMARLDWNINKNNKVNVRYSMVKNKYSSIPSSSISPLGNDVYNRKTYGRTSYNALYFESSRYYQEQNFSSVAGEWNSSFSNGRGNNMLRFTYSHQNEPRSFEGDLFPTVDILQTIDVNGTPTKAVLTSFGPDPFTYGNLRDVRTIVATDEVTYQLGKHDLIGGFQYEWDKTQNGYMQGGAGYYVYDSWTDFVNGANPAAFAITYGNNANHDQVFPSFKYNQFSLYFQDEMNLSERFKLSAGIRFELPTYPSTAAYNTNNEFLNGWDKDGVHYSIADGKDNTMYGMSTSDMPNARLSFSPRVGFNWDITGDRKLILRGGTGLFTGRLPFVWIVSAVGNSNCMQNQYISNTPVDIAFETNVNDIIATNSALLSTGDLPAPQSTTIMDKNLKMPQAWKTNLALDAKLPGGIKGTLEGVFSYDITAVAVQKLGIVRDSVMVNLPGEKEGRWHWASEGIKNSIGGAVTPYYITNSDKHGYYGSITGELSKNFKCGLNVMAAYTYANSKNVIDGIGDQVTSAFNTNTFGVNGSNAQELGYSSYVSPNRILVALNWTFNSGKRSQESISLYYEGVNLAYVSGFSYSRYSYTMNSNVTGDGGANSLIYIPTTAELFAKNEAGEYVMPFVSDLNRQEYEDFINGDKYLMNHRGQYAERGGVVAPMHHSFNFKYERTIGLDKSNYYKLTFGIDVNNIANLIYRGWGNYKELSSSDILAYGKNKDTGKMEYTFTSPKWGAYAGTLSTWSAALNLRFSF